MIKLFIFDMGGVLTQNFNILPEAAEILGFEYYELLDLIRNDLVDLMEGTLTAPDFWKRLSESSGCRNDRELWSELFNPFIDEEMKRIIKDLGRSHRVVCGTNTLAGHYNIHKNRGDYNVFDRVYASHLMGIAKPNPEFYSRILEEEGVSPEETVFTDDFPENIETAKGLGINSFIFKDTASFMKDLDEARLKLS